MADQKNIGDKIKDNDEWKILGRVISDQGRTLPGVTITVGNRKPIAYTDKDGFFRIPVEYEDQLLRFSLKGYAACTTAAFDMPVVLFEQVRPI